ncbi:OLC1v1016165C1 [Oldenlandia corymbosa var. corymbosa]|uniref:OLC1v1016165C1 n=1 Tax=Oldenlandia corymbosa var. corymbosa TaxID=529605 RepID=A0AAV1E4T4_OLDCO|nr:OLC1v1016165C1 [Oldenlandia corymbosa var. corymbosa]
MADQVLSVLLFVSDRMLNFLSEEGRPFGGLRQEIQLISYEFGHMKAFLQKVAESKHDYDDSQLREWIRQVRDSAYDTEDVIDEFMILFAAPQRLLGFRGSVLRNINSITNFRGRHQLANKLQSLRGRIKNISEARLRYESHYERIIPQIPRRAWRDSKDDDALLAGEAQLVGIDESKKHLISEVLEGGSQLKVIAVLGMGGLGKTTLVKQVHDDATVKNNFQIRAWMTVSQTCDLEKLLKSLIRQLYSAFNEPVMPGMDSMGIYELKVVIRVFLQRARYEIVFDDMWDREFWDALKFVLPENRFGGNCVILTTRISEVAFAACNVGKGYVYRMKHLTFEDSWSLFCRETFKQNLCPSHLENVAEAIVGKCEGLPLAIVAISGLLATKDCSRIEEWERVRNKLRDDELEGTGRLERAKKILRLSYDDLPPTLKTCLLYTSIYPEDHEILCSRLIRLWVAERFVEARSGLAAEEVAWDYVQELANRSLIQMTTSSAMVVRRLVFHNSPIDDTISERHHHFSNLRSLIALGCKEPPSNALLTELIMSNKFLKVLNLHGVPMEEIPKSIFDLFHLNHLSLAYTKIKIVPQSIKKLRNLECLDLKNTNVKTLPMEILKLQKLHHLFVIQHVDFSNRDLGCYGFIPPSNMGKLTELQTLERVDASENDKTRILSEIGKLVRLRSLGITDIRPKDGKELCSSLVNLTSLRALRLTSSIEEKDKLLDLGHCFSPTSLPSIGHLSLRGRLEKMPPWIRNLERLRSIKLTWSCLKDGPLESLQYLPNLIEVSLIQAYEGESLCFKAGGFPKLQKLQLQNMKGLMWLRVEEGAMPKIKRLVLQELPLLEELPSGFENLRQLEELELWSVSSHLTMKLESEAFQECEEYEQIAHIPRVLLGFRRDGRWSLRVLSQKKRAITRAARQTFDTNDSVAATLVCDSAICSAAPSFWPLGFHLLLLVCFFLFLCIFIRKICMI